MVLGAGAAQSQPVAHRALTELELLGGWKGYRMQNQL